MLTENDSTNNEAQRFKNNLKGICEQYLNIFPAEKDRLRRLSDLLSQSHVDVRLHEGHACASGIIVSHDLSQILMVLHKKLGIWVVPGGHYQLEDDTLANTALRETYEETGFNGLMLHPWHNKQGIPLDIDTHEIAADSARGEGNHVHFDLRYALVTPSFEEIDIDPRELLGFQWMNIEEIDPNSSIAPAVAKLPLLLNMH